MPIELFARSGTEGRVVVEVLDRGPGLPAAVREEFDGAAGGLGLRIAKSFAEAAGGSLALCDRPGGGTVARLDLPASRAHEEAAA
jgi:two-component system sensor histidine kinase TctE